MLGIWALNPPAEKDRKPSLVFVSEFAFLSGRDAAASVETGGRARNEENKDSLSG